MIIMSAISGAMAIFTTIMSIKEGNKEYKESSAARIEKYNAYISKKKKEIEEHRDQEHTELEELFVSQPVETERFSSFSADLLIVHVTMRITYVYVLVAEMFFQSEK